jgi:D-beta-D-heptose 7-phosphate kinase/D-beta-D-heptose 1-phosphate adenosyltransferase
MFDANSQPRILVLGDLILDRYTFGNAERVSPEAPVVVLRVDAQEVRLGGAASVAMLLRGLGADVALAGVIGDDSNGRTLMSLLCDDRIDHSFVITDPQRPTTCKERVIGRAADRHAHQIVRIDHESREPIGGELEAELIDRVTDVAWDGAANVPVIQTALEGRTTGVGDAASVGEHISPAPLQCQFPTGQSQRTALEGNRTDFDAVLISDYAKGVCTPALLRRIIDAARARNIPVVIDPARIADYSRYAGATLLKPNRIEAELATGLEIKTPDQALIAAAALRERHDIGSVIITLDRDGMVLYCAESDNRGCIRHDGSRIREECGEVDDLSAVMQSPVADDSRILGKRGYFPCVAREVYDITGAGDTVLATLGYCMATGLPLSRAIAFANTAAGLQVQRLGVSPVSREELAAALNSQSANSPMTGFRTGSPTQDLSASQAAIGPALKRPIPHSEQRIFQSVSELMPILNGYREQGRSLVFTNGCFDLLHIGHVTMLEQAAALGDILIVAINSDASVRRLKGPDRPVIAEQHRARMLASLGCVARVLIFDEPTPHNLLAAIRPDILAKGGPTPEIIGREFVESYGGRVVRLGEVPGISTTSLLASRSFQHKPNETPCNTVITNSESRTVPLPDCPVSVPK